MSELRDRTARRIQEELRGLTAHQPSPYRISSIALPAEHHCIYEAVYDQLRRCIYTQWYLSPWYICTYGVFLPKSDAELRHEQSARSDKLLPLMAEASELFFGKPKSLVNEPGYSWMRELFST